MGKRALLGRKSTFTADLRMSSLDIAEYTTSLLSELAKMAKSAKMSSLGRLIDMATEEAALRAQVESASIRSTSFRKPQSIN